MADLTARPDSWTDYLPGDWQQAINTSPLLNALRGAVNRPTPDMTRGIEHDQYGSVSDRNWLLQQAAGGPPKMNPLAAEMLDKGGLLANFLGPGVKLPAAVPKPTGIRAYHGSPHDIKGPFQTPAFFSPGEWYARVYKNSGGDAMKYNGIPHGRAPGYAQAAQAVDEHGGDVLMAIASLEARHKNAIRPPSIFDRGIVNSLLGRGKALPVQDREYADEIAAGIAHLKSGKPTGYMYEVELPQPDLVVTPETLKRFGITSEIGSETKIVKAAQERGYKLMSLYGGNELVALDPSIIKILRKYGLLPPVAAGTAAALNQQEPPL